MHPFDQGYAAADSGHRITDNPYPKNTTEHNDWERGYRASYECPF